MCHGGTKAARAVFLLSIRAGSPSFVVQQSEPEQEFGKCGWALGFEKPE